MTGDMDSAADDLTDAQEELLVRSVAEMMRKEGKHVDEETIKQLRAAAHMTHLYSCPNGCVAMIVWIGNASDVPKCPECGRRAVPLQMR